MKWLILIALGLNGCSMTSLLFGVKSEDPVVLVDNPPMRMIYSGKFSKSDREMFRWMLMQMDRIPYKDHTYNFPIGASISINEGDTSSHGYSFNSSTSTKRESNVPKESE